MNSSRHFFETGMRLVPFSALSTSLREGPGGCYGEYRTQRLILEAWERLQKFL
jgi:hypothetical protein